VALLTKELLKILPVKLIGGLTRQVFQWHTAPFLGKEGDLRGPPLSFDYH
jgi:hypothetical protein